jgi:hypothetical protein
VVAVGLEQLQGLQLHQLDQLSIGDVEFVDEDHQLLDPHLLGQEHVLSGLGLGTLRAIDQQDRAVHLGGPGDHVLHVVRVARTVDVGVVPNDRLVLHVSGDDGQDLGRIPTTFGRRTVGDLIVALGFAPDPGGLHGRQGGGQRGLAVIHVTDGADVEVLLLLRHGVAPFLGLSVQGARRFEALGWARGPGFVR